MEGAPDHFLLLFPGETVEVHRVAGDPNGETGVFFRMVHGVHQGLPLQNVDIEVVSALDEVAVQNGRQVVPAL